MEMERDYCGPMKEDMFVWVEDTEAEAQLKKKDAKLKCYCQNKLRIRLYNGSLSFPGWERKSRAEVWYCTVDYI